ncbi:hypothetical protein V501_05734 [Pseudogymnoascus sp. VKM F-4519 (FW-2642)]|nr:hypothetical protein V501_05734 [Pseudogymnoascus sp. VKM F-4519 (FW-2642)]
MWRADVRAEETIICPCRTPSSDPAAQGTPMRRCIALTVAAVEDAGDREEGGSSTFTHSNTRLTQSTLLAQFLARHISVAMEGFHDQHTRTPEYDGNEGGFPTLARTEVPPDLHGVAAGA